MKITFVIPSRNNLEFLKLAYNSIRKLETKHEILVLDDASTDGTADWIKDLADPDLITYVNKGPERIGIVGMFDKGIEMARTDIIFAYHADMVAGPNLDKNILKHLKRGTVVSATRVEPPLHPPGPEKITQNFHIGPGCEADNFDNEAFNEWCIRIGLHYTKTTEGIFAPWCMYKEDFLAVGGHDELFAPQSKEDSDLFNRFQLAGYKFIQPWDALVYHFTSRGSRFNKHAGGAAGKNSEEWLYTTNKNGREFIRKWGHFIKHDQYMKPIIPPKYNIGIRVKNCSQELLHALEPWCNAIYSDAEYLKYITLEQPNTKYNLKERCFSSSIIPKSFAHHDIIVEIADGSLVNSNNFYYINELTSILKDSGEPGEFELDIFKITINQLKEIKI